MGHETSTAIASGRMGAVEQSLRKAFAAGVYFHAPEGVLSHNSGCLMEGMIELGIPVRCNTHRLTSRHVSMPMAGVDLKPMVSEPYSTYAGYIVDISHGNAYIPFTGIKGALAYLTSSDVSVFCRIPDEFPLFSTHETRLASKGGVRHPIAFGLSRGVIGAMTELAPFATRERKALRNFRATLSQSVRAMLDLSYVPRLAREVTVDGNVVPPLQYVAALKSAAICLAYGGDFYSPIMRNDWFAKNEPQLFKTHTFEHFTGAAAVLRWDSWRLWESLVAGCLTVHLDFEKYGFLLPEMPVAWKHYVPIDLSDIEGSVARLLASEPQWADIAEAGRVWALAHYAPKPTAIRVLSSLVQKSS